MQVFFRTAIFIFSLGILFGQGALAANSSSVVCDSPYKGQSLSREKLVELLKQSGQTTLNLCGTDLHGSNLSHLNLKGIDLQGADLSEAKFIETNLSDAKLYKTYFRWADLTQADLQRADLRSASFESAKLNQANLTLAKLTQANLAQADLSSATLAYTDLVSTNLTDAVLMAANLQWANLTNADLSGSNLSKTFFGDAILKQANLSNTLMDQTDFSEADLLGAYFQPRLDSLPDLVALSTAKHFQTIRFDKKRGLPPLLKIRTAYKKIGLVSMERQITAIVKTKQMKQAWQRGGLGYIESAFNFVFFYLPSDFGAAPGRALIIFFLFILIFTLPYYLALAIPVSRAGIWVYWRSRKSQQAAQHVVNKDEQWYKKLIRLRCVAMKRNLLREHWRLFRIALYFSLLSAFSLGWQQLNPHSWMRRIQLRDYQFKAYGWIKVLSGIQPLLSAYLLVLWALTYFGHPFEW